MANIVSGADSVSVAGYAAASRLFDGATVLCDGAMGTMLYARGVFINRCYDELSISRQEQRL
jgi:methionine synthase I (cobalamin-dependent)